MLGWREPPVWLESQGAAFIVINENMFNLIPAVPIILGAGGCCVDFDGRPLRERKIVEGRTSVAYAANELLCEKVLGLIGTARGLVRVGG
jgi:fructose-1,6-bisphosphatase/inositol monophosphatase family enzyme